MALTERQGVIRIWGNLALLCLNEGHDGGSLCAAVVRLNWKALRKKDGPCTQKR